MGDSFLFYVVSCAWGALCTAAPVFLYPDTFEVNRTVAVIWSIFVCVWFLPILLNSRLVEDKATQRQDWIKRVRDIFVAFTAFGLSTVALRHRSSFLDNVGVLLAVIGLIVAVAARFSLGKQWRGTPEVRADHQLVTDGYGSAYSSWRTLFVSADACVSCHGCNCGLLRAYSNVGAALVAH